MILWLLMNVLLPLLPLFVVSFVARALSWKMGVLDIIGDGQLYYFSATIWGVFAFDAIRMHSMQPEYYAVILIILLTLTAFYMASLFFSYSGKYHSKSGSWRQGAPGPGLLTNVSIAAGVFSVLIVCYARWALGML